MAKKGKAPSKSGTWVGKTHIPGKGGRVSIRGGRSSSVGSSEK